MKLINVLGVRKRSIKAQVRSTAAKYSEGHSIIPEDASSDTS